MQVDDEDIQYLLSKVDKNNDKQIDLVEFTAVMHLAPDQVPAVLAPLVDVGSLFMKGITGIGQGLDFLGKSASTLWGAPHPACPPELRVFKEARKHRPRTRALAYREGAPTIYTHTHPHIPLCQAFSFWHKGDKGQRSKRVEVWKQWDSNANGYLSLAECDSNIKSHLISHCKSKVKGEAIWRCLLKEPVRWF